MKIRWID